MIRENGSIAQLRSATSPCIWDRKTLIGVVPARLVRVVERRGISKFFETAPADLPQLLPQNPGRLDDNESFTSRSDLKDLFRSLKWSLLKSLLLGN